LTMRSIWPLWLCVNSCCAAFPNYPGCGRFGDEGPRMDTEDRIINGVEVTEQRPWMARIIYLTKSERLVCDQL